MASSGVVSSIAILGHSVQEGWLVVSDRRSTGLVLAAEVRVDWNCLRSNGSLPVVVGSAF